MFDPVTIILVLLLVLVTILYFTKKPQDRVELKLLNSNFKEVSLPLSSPDGKFKLETKELVNDDDDNIKNSLIFTYENQAKGFVEFLYIKGQEKIIFVLTDDGKELYSDPITFVNSYNITSYTSKLYESYDSNIYRLIHVLNDKFIISMTGSIQTTTKPKLSLSDDKKFVISNLTIPGSTNTELRLDIFDIIFPE